MSAILFREGSPQRIGFKSLLFLVVAASLWTGAVYLRPYTLNTHCVSDPAGCTTSNVVGFDQIAIGRVDHDADSRSFDTQRWSGTVAVLGMWAWIAALVILGRLPPLNALKLAGIDLALLLQAYVANGALNELVKTLVERPRPFVYPDPARFGLDPAHYTSFYSGHASFAAVGAATLVITLRRRGAPLPVWLLAGGVGAGLAFATAYFRVAAGRHFPTDVMAGLVFGAGAAIAVSWVHSRAHHLASRASAS